MSTNRHTKPGAFDFETPVERRGTLSDKWNRAGTDAIPMWVADMDFPTAPAVLEALHSRVDHGVFGYSSAPAELALALADQLAREVDWPVDPDWIVYAPNIVSALNLVVRTFIEPGESVLTHVPAYPPFLHLDERAGRDLRTTWLVDDGERWVPDADATAAACTADVGGFLLCNPQNPTGRMFDRDELQVIAALAAERGLTVLADEVHHQLVMDPTRRHLPFAAAFPELAAQTITFLGPTKSFNLAGIGGCALVIPDATLRERYLAAKLGVLPNVPVFFYDAALAACRDGGPWLEALLDCLRGNHNLLMQHIETWPAHAHRVEATYLAWLDCRCLGPDPHARLLAGGIDAHDGALFAAPGWIRLNFACPRATLEQALERLDAVFNTA